MKKLICIVLTLAVLLSCAACAKKQTDEKTAAMETTIDRSSPEGMFGHIDQTVPVDGVYKIWSAVGVLNMVNHPDAKFELLCDVDMQGAVLAPIGSEQTPFTGSIEGTNYNIMNFTVQGSGESFGFVAVNKGSIQNLRLQNVTFLPADNAKFIGTCAGINEGNISRCYYKVRLFPCHHKRNRIKSFFVNILRHKTAADMYIGNVHNLKITVGCEIPVAAFILFGSKLIFNFNLTV